MSHTRTVRDPFLNKEVQVSDRLVDRLRGKYAIGPVMPNGEPEFGWREMPVPPIHKEAADMIELLEGIIDPPICRLQLPDGCVPGNAKEAAEGWKKWADHYRMQAETFERQYRQCCMDHATAMEEIKGLRAALGNPKP